MTPEPTPHAAPETAIEDTPRKTRNRNRAVAVGAVAVVVLLVGAILWSVAPHAGDAVGEEGTQSESALSTPDAVVAEARSVLPTLATGIDPADDAVADAQAAVDEAEATARSAIVNDAMAQADDLEDALADTGLPRVPAGYSVGGDVTGYLGTVASAPYQAPLVQAGDLSSGLSTLDPASVGGTFATGTGAPSTGVAPVDEATGQVGVLDNVYDQLWGQDLDTVLSGLGQGVPTGDLPVPAGLPTDGLLPGAPDADDGAINPDGEGAQNALLFGYELTDGVTGALYRLDGDAGTVLADHAILVSQVEAAAAQARSLEAQGTADVETQLQQRLSDADATTAARVTELTQAQADLEARARATAAEAQAHVDATAAEARARLQGTADANAQSLLEEAARAQADAQARSAAVDAQARQYLDLLAQMQEEQGVDVSQHVADVRAQAADVQATIQSGADAREAELLQAAEDLRADAESRAAALADVDTVDLQARADAAVAESHRALAFGLALADAQHAAAVTAHTDAAAQATTDLQARADAEVENVRARALGYLDASEDFATTGQALVWQLQDDGSAHLHTAVSYVEDVAEDYASVPEPERQAQAEALLEEATTLSSVGTGALDSGVVVSEHFDAVLRSSQGLRAQVEAIPL